MASNNNISSEAADANTTTPLPSRSIASSDPYMIELLRQQHENLSKMAALLQIQTPSPVVPPVIYPAGAMPMSMSTDPRAMQTSAPPLSSMEAKHPRMLRNRQYSQQAWDTAPVPGNGFVASPRSSSSKELNRSLAMPPVYNRSFRGMDNATIVSGLECSEGSFSELSTTSWSATASKNTAKDQYQNIMNVSRRFSDTKGKMSEKQQSEQRMIPQGGSANMDPPDYSALIAGRRKNNSSLNESKLAEYENLLADKSMSPRKTAKPKKSLLTVSQKLKAVTTIMTSSSLALDGNRASSVGAATDPSGHTVNTDDSSESSSQRTSSSSTKKGRDKLLKMDPVCLSPISLDHFQKYSSATNDPARAQLIRKQLKPPVKREKIERPKKEEASEWAKMLTTKDFRYHTSHQSHSNRFRSFDERLMSGENEGRIL